MNKEVEKRIAAKLARRMVILSVRNMRPENIHAGKSRVTMTCDLSDVTVVEADGNRIPWKDVSRISDSISFVFATALLSGRQ